jgi:hypothetical protein
MSGSGGRDRRPGGSPRRPARFEPDRILSALIDDHGVRFIIVGGFAVAAHGRVRGTKDIDICPDPDPENLQRLADALEDLNAEPLEIEELEGELDLEPDLEGLSAGGNWRLATRFGQLDVMQYLSGLERGYAALDSHAEEREFLGHRVRFCGYRDLIAMKEAAARPQDLIDVQDLRAARGEL